MGFVKDAWNGITGKSSAKAAEKAGQLQADSSKYAADLAQKQYEQTRQDQMPWLNMGNAALQQLGAFTGISPQLTSPQLTSPQLTSGQQQAPTQHLPAALPTKKNGGNGAKLGGFFKKIHNYANAQNSGGQTVPQVSQVGVDGQPTPSQGATSAGMPQYTDKWGDRLESAYTDGKLTGGLDPNNFQTDPSYQFRKQQGMDGIESSAAAGGGLLSGAALKSLNAFNSNLASQEYGNAWQRDQAEKNNLFNVLSGNRAQDYNLWSNERTRQYNELASLAGVGQQTATQLGQFGALNAQNQGNAAIAGANAQANGLTAGAAAQANGWGNILGLGMKAAGMFI